MTAVNLRRLRRRIFWRVKSNRSGEFPRHEGLLLGDIAHPEYRRTKEDD